MFALLLALMASLVSHVAPQAAVAPSCSQSVSAHATCNTQPKADHIPPGMG